MGGWVDSERKVALRAVTGIRLAPARAVLNTSTPLSMSSWPVKSDDSAAAAIPAARARVDARCTMTRLRRLVGACVCGLGLCESAWSAEAIEYAKPAAAHFTATGEAWQNARGGLERGGWWNMIVTGSAELDGSRFGGPAGSSVFLHIHWVENRDGASTFADKTGAFNPVSGIIASNHLRVFNLYYAQGNEVAGWKFKIGQLAADDDFMLSDYAPLFANAAFGAMPSQVATPVYRGSGRASAAYPIFAVAAPGAWAEFKLADNVTWQTAAFHGTPGEDRPGNHGFDWRHISDPGVGFFSEIAVESTVAGHLAHTKVGVTGHTGRFDDLDAIAAGAANDAVRGLGGAYLVQDLSLAKAADGETKFGVFARVGVSPQRDRGVVTFYADGGFNWLGPLPCRPNDTCGVALSTTRFGGAFRNVAGAAPSETTLEAAYRIQITERFTVQADAQWLFGALADTASGHRNTAIVFGVRSSVAF